MNARLMSSGVARILCGSFLLASALAITGGTGALSSSAGATEPALQLSASSVDFGNVTLGSGAVSIITVTNTTDVQTGSSDVIPLPTTSGADQLDFFALPNIEGLIDPDLPACQSVNPFSDTSDFFSVILPPGGSCAYFVAFAPVALGARSGTIPFDDNLNSGASISVSGNGTIGYYQVSSTGKVASFGDAQSFGDASQIPLNSPIVAMAQTGDSGGYWLAAADGGIFNYGDATFLGSAGGIHLNKPIVGMASMSDGVGYWLVATDGGIFNYGDAQFYGSTGSIALNKPIVGMAATADGGGYWLVAADGGVFNYGDAGFFGSAGSLHLNKPIVGMAATPDGGGYWLVASDGGIFSYGDATFYGSTGALHLNQPIVGMTAMPDGGGYWFTAADGGLFNYGDAPFYGSGAAQSLGHVVAMTTDGQPIFDPGLAQSALRSIPALRNIPALRQRPGILRAFESGAITQG
jgi:hypothetical protein